MYTYAMMLKDIKSLNNVDVEIIGVSHGGRAIPCLHTGSFKGKQLIVCSAIHAREHITALLAMRLLARFDSDKTLLCGGGIYFIPMANPDGVCLCEKGLSSVKSYADRQMLKEINCSEDFSLWKANARGVDLNVNFNARFGTGKQNVFFPAPENYVGEAPLCEAETRALADFTRRIKPSAVICYHCKGEVIYWKFHQKKNLFRDRALAEELSRLTGYSLIGEGGSAGGYKDWCIQEFGIPAFTVEVGNDDFAHPFPYEKFEDIYKQNKDLPSLLLKKLTDNLFMENNSEKYMKEALKQAEKAFQRDEVPVGCVIVQNGKIIARAYNRREELQDATAHAEILCIKKACLKLGSFRLNGCDMYVTLEPCPMCAGAIINSRLDRVFFGAFDPKGGCCKTLYQLPSDGRFNHTAVTEGGIMEDECAAVLKNFFLRMRKISKEL